MLSPRVLGSGDAHRAAKASYGSIDTAIDLNEAGDMYKTRRVGPRDPTAGGPAKLARTPRRSSRIV
jgi:hypothetical protein